MTDTTTQGSAIAQDVHRRVQRRTLMVLVVSQIVGTIGVGVAPSIGVLIAGQVTDNEALAGLARTASTLGAALVSIPLGRIAGRFGRRTALSLGWLVAALGGFVLVFAAQLMSPALLFPGLLLVGVGSAVSLQSRFAATDLAQPRHRARALALVVWVGTIGSVLGPNLGIPGAALGRETGLTVFAAAFLIAAVCLAVAGVVVFVALRPDPLSTLQRARLSAGLPDAEAKGRPRGMRVLLTELRRNPKARLAFLAVVSGQVVMVAMMTMAPVHIAHSGGSVTIVGITISLHVASMYVLAPVVGLIVDRFGARTAINIGIVTFTASLATAACAPDSMVAITVSLILLGLGWSFGNVAGSAMFAANVSGSARATAQGSLDAFSNYAGAMAALAAGPLLEATNYSFLSVLALAVLVPLAWVLNIRTRTRAAA